jgi:metal-responsive CopG/Arc/MetJ family transcriptional regulator
MLALWQFYLIQLSYNTVLSNYKEVEMSNRQKVTITIDEAILKDIDRLSEKEGKNRSQLIEKAVKAWRQKRLEKELIEGYAAMAEEDLETAEANLEAGVEALK